MGVVNHIAEESMTESDRHKNKLVVGIRGADEELRDAARDAAAKTGHDLSSITVAFWRWLAGKPGAELPERPAAE
jgi:hypothetical protein